MYLMYVDESGDTGLSGSPTEFFALSGLVVHETNWRQFITALVNFKKAMRAIYGLPLRTEIHSSEFIKSKVAGLPRYSRLAILRNALDELAKTPNISITNVVVDKANKPADFDVFDFAWRTLPAIRKYAILWEFSWKVFSRLWDGFDGRYCWREAPTACSKDVGV